MVCGNQGWHLSCRTREHAQDNNRPETVRRHVCAAWRAELALHAPALYSQTLTWGGIRVAPNDLKIFHCAPPCSRGPSNSLMVSVADMSTLAAKNSRCLESPPKNLRESRRVGTKTTSRLCPGKGRLGTSVVRAWNREGPQPYVLCRGLPERSNAQTARFGCKGANKFIAVTSLQ